MADSLLWLPESAKELVCLDSFDIEDLDTQVFINTNLVNWLNGKLDTGTLVDMLMQYDINPSILDDYEKYVKYLGGLC
jgi:hypothetical protein